MTHADNWLDWLINIKVPMWEAEATQGRLPQEQWDILRKESLKRDRYVCQGCAQSKPLAVHHIIPIHKGGNNHLSNLISICEDCHARIHDWLRNL